jgi:hypothetical protein
MMISGFQPKGSGSKELDAALRELTANIVKPTLISAQPTARWPSP